MRKLFGLCLAVAALLFFVPRHLEENPHHNPVNFLLGQMSAPAVAQGERVCTRIEEIADECGMDTLTAHEARVTVARLQN